MPIFEFYCVKCESAFEKLYTKVLKGTPKPKCIYCSAPRAKKIISQVSIKFNDEDSQTSKKRSRSVLGNRKVEEAFLESEAKLSQERMDTRDSPYQTFDYTPPKDPDKGPRRISDKELVTRVKRAKDITIEMHKGAGTLDTLGKPII